jgi:hypothetical protein
MRFNFFPIPRLIVFDETKDHMTDSTFGMVFLSLTIFVCLYYFIVFLNLFISRATISDLNSAAMWSLFSFTFFCGGLSGIGMKGRAKNGLILVVGIVVLIELARWFST